MAQYRYRKDQPGILLPEQSEEEETTAAWDVIEAIDTNADEPKLASHYVIVRMETPDKAWWASVDQGGCVNLKHQAAADLEGNEWGNYIHLCDIDEWIERLQAIKQIASEHDMEFTWEFPEEEN